jgi:hypothetical protein
MNWTIRVDDKGALYCNDTELGVTEVAYGIDGPSSASERAGSPRESRQFEPEEMRARFEHPPRLHQVGDTTFFGRQRGAPLPAISVLLATERGSRVHIYKIVPRAEGGWKLEGPPVPFDAAHVSTGCCEIGLSQEKPRDRTTTTTKLYLVHHSDYDSCELPVVVRAISYTDARERAAALDPDRWDVYEIVSTQSLNPAGVLPLREDPELLSSRAAEKARLEKSWAAQREAEAEAARWIVDRQLGPHGKPTGKTRRRLKGEPFDPAKWDE